MNVVIYVCLFLAALSGGSLGLPSQSMSQQGEALVLDDLSSPPAAFNQTRQVRSARAPPSDRLGYGPDQEDADARSKLSQLLARLISRKGPPTQTKTSISSRASGPSPPHRLMDRDYQGWMDFGRRSAEDEEYSS